MTGHLLMFSDIWNLLFSGVDRDCELNERVD